MLLLYIKVPPLSFLVSATLGLRAGILNGVLYDRPTTFPRDHKGTE